MPLSYATVWYWSQWTGNVPDPLELDALFALDAVLLDPGELKEGE